MPKTIPFALLLAWTSLVSAQEGHRWIDLQGGTLSQKDSWTRNAASTLLQDSRARCCSVSGTAGASELTSDDPGDGSGPHICRNRWAQPRLTGRTS